MSGRICRAHAQRGVSVQRECTQSGKRARGAGERACVHSASVHRPVWVSTRAAHAGQSPGTALSGPR